MQKPDNLKTRIFLDSGDPNETREIISLLGFLDGQTTNPTLVSKNPKAKARFEAGDTFTEEEIYGFYKDVVTEVSALVPESVSIEVYADANTKAEQMIEQGKQMNTWIPNAHIKLPTTTEGLKAAHALVQEGIRVNMTLVFTQAQAAAVYAATAGASAGQVYLSPFIGRLDDLSLNGMDLIQNILTMYKAGDGHVHVLTASVRSLDHLFATMQLEADLITVPYKILKEWAANDLAIPDGFTYKPAGLAAIPLEEYDLEASWESFDIHHDLTEKGIARFSEDWNKLIRES